MKKLLFSLGIGCALLLIVLGFEALGLEGSLSLLCLPFVLCAKGLRMLSLSGNIGNWIAIALFVVCGCVPLLFKLGKKWAKEDILLVLLCPVLWCVLYYLINPSLLPITLSGQVGQLILCGIIWELLLCWALIRLVRSSSHMESRQYLLALKLFLLLCAAQYGISVILCFTSLPQAIQTVNKANTMPGLNLFPTYLFMFLSNAVSALEYGLDAWALLLGAGLLSQLQNGPYTQEAVTAAERISAWCRRSLLTVLLSHTALHLSQAVFAAHIHQLSANFRFPILSLAILFALLALSGLLKKGQQLQEDNDLFI